MNALASWAGKWVVMGTLAAFAAAPAVHAQAGQSGQKQTEQKQKPEQNAQSQGSQNQGSQSQGSQSQGSPDGSAQKPSQNGGNPFPEDENAVPLMPSGNAPDYSADMNGDAHVAAPAVDKDPVRSPEDEAPSGSDSNSGFSSSQSGLGNVMSPPPGEPERKGKKGDDSALDAFPRETPKEDLNVGNYYLDIKDWRGALSRFQSALVLAPDNPDVYWGLAECERHLGQFAEARANYLKVMEYDPGSHHAKEAKKALRDPEIANAKPVAGQAHP